MRCAFSLLRQKVYSVSMFFPPLVHVYDVNLNLNAFFKYTVAPRNHVNYVSSVVIP